MKTLHHKSKRYEVQQYDWRNLSWYPVYHATEPEEALRRMTSAVKKGYYTRILDREGGGVVEAGRPNRPKYQCEACADTKENIVDRADHNGEHRQITLLCVCTIE